MKKYIVTGMSCAACSAKVEKVVGKLNGVTSCTVNLLTNSMGVEGEVSDDDIIAAVRNAGYQATTMNDSENSEINGNSTSSRKHYMESLLEDKETPLLKKRLIYSCIFLLVLMYFSMGHTMWNWPVHEYFGDNAMAMGLLQLILTSIIMFINKKFFVNGYKGLIKSPNMDTLVALGASAAYVYSIVMLFAMSTAMADGDMNKAHSYIHELYFESAAMILTLITVGKMLEARSKGKTTNAIKSLIKLTPNTATVIRDGSEIVVPIEELRVGDIFIVKSGESIPTDGVIIDGTAAINESAITGESMPIDKKVSDMISGATLCETGYIKCEATKIGEDTVLSKIIKLVSDASATKAPIAKIADKVSGVFVPIVIGIAIIVFAIWMVCGATVGYALARAISVLVISCPCALGLATPVAIMVGNGVGARNGILYKTAEVIETVGKVDIIALDKTGTITTGKMFVTDIYTSEGIEKLELLRVAASLESLSEHPIANAIVKMWDNENRKDRDIKDKELYEVIDYEVLPGNGICGKIKDRYVWAGKYNYIDSITKINKVYMDKSNEMAKQGKTPVFVACEDSILGIIAVGDIVHFESIEAIDELKALGIRTVMLTGDNYHTAKNVADRVGIEEIIAEVLPEGKEKVIRKLKNEGIVAMVGDGINDAPALTTADIGIAIGSGTEVAIDAADIVLTKNNILNLPATVRISRRIIRNIRQNLFWAFFYNAVGIPLAAGVFVYTLGWELTPMFGAFAMGLSSFCVVSNALRLNLIKVYDPARDRKRNNMHNKNMKKRNKKVEVLNMTKTLTIEGMMCKHCEANVKKILESMAEVDTAEVSHELKTAVITLNADVADEVLVKAIEDNDYKVISVE